MHRPGCNVWWRPQPWFYFYAPVYLDFIFAFNERVSYLTKCLTPSQLTTHDLEQILAAHTTLNTWPPTQRALPHTETHRRTRGHKKRGARVTRDKKAPSLSLSLSIFLFITRLLWFNVGDYTSRWILRPHNVNIVQFGDISNQIMSISVYKSLWMKTPCPFFLSSHSCPVFVNWQSILIHSAVTSLLAAVWQRRNKPSIQMN